MYGCKNISYAVESYTKLFKMLQKKLEMLFDDAPFDQMSRRRRFAGKAKRIILNESKKTHTCQSQNTVSSNFTFDRAPTG